MKNISAISYLKNLQTLLLESKDQNELEFPPGVFSENKKLQDLEISSASMIWNSNSFAGLENLTKIVLN